MKIKRDKKNRMARKLNRGFMGEVRGFFRCFNYFNFYDKYHYLGYILIPFRKGTEPYNKIKAFVKKVDERIRPWYVPIWFLNLLHYYGNDNSIIRVRNWRLHRLHRKITKGAFFTDMKTKFDSMRIYATLPEDLDKECEELCKEMDEKYLEPY